jgi:phosphate transport system protein
VRDTVGVMLEARHQFRENLRELELQTLGGIDLVVGQLDRALESVTDHDAALAGIVVAGDRRIDTRYLEIHNSALSLLALQTPVAGDLRILAALLHVSRCIERMGDQCANIAKLVPLSGCLTAQDRQLLEAVERMGILARDQLTEAKDAFKTRHVSLARDLVGQSARLGRLNREIFNRAVEIGDDIDAREWAMFMILVARALERIGDNAVEIAKQTIFIVTGLFREFPDASQPA